MVFDSDAMGLGFWFKILALAIAAAIGAGLAILLISSVFVKWGLFGGLLAIAAVLILIGWISDRRRRDDPYTGPPTAGGDAATPRRGPFQPPEA